MELLWMTENYFPDVGGMAQSCDRIIYFLRKNNIKVHVLHFTNKKRGFQTENKLNGTYTALPIHSDVSHTLNRCLNFLTNPNRSFSFNKIIAFGGMLPMLSAPVYAKLFNSDLFVLIRGNDFDVSVFDPKKKYYLDQAFDNAKAICANSLDKCRKIKKIYPNTNVNYTPNGIDTEHWCLLRSEKEFAQQWRNEEIDKEGIIVGLFGILKVKKGVVFFINALLKSRQEESVHLLFTDAIPQAVQLLLLKNDISYTIIPFMKRDELLKYYSICDWVAIPSFYEGMPNVLFEAGSLGIPVLASNIDGMKDVLTHNETGLLFHPSDEKACSYQIMKAINMLKKDREKMGINLKNLIVNDFTPEKEAENYIQVFNGNYSKTGVYSEA